MTVRIDYYPNSVAGGFGLKKEQLGMFPYYKPQLEEIAELIGDNSSVIVEEKPYRIGLIANSEKELSDLAFRLSEERLKKPGLSLPFDLSKVYEITN